MNKTQGSLSSHGRGRSSDTGTVCRNPDDILHESTHVRCPDEANSQRQKAGEGSPEEGGQRGSGSRCLGGAGLLSGVVTKFWEQW